MRLLRYLKRRAALLDELETLRAENARLRYDLATALIVSWVRLNPLPEQKPAPKRSEPHHVHPGRHCAEPTEIHPRRPR